MPQEEEKPVPKITEPSKSSMEILSELFSTFDAEPPIIVKKEKEETKKHKKSKKKHKHKDKKHKKKEKKRKRSNSITSEQSAVDLAELLIKQERLSPDKKIKLEELPTEHTGDTKNVDSKITIKNLKFSSIFKATIRDVSNKVSGEGHEEGELLASDKSDNDRASVVESSKKKRKHKREEKPKKKKRRSHRSCSKEKSKSERSPKHDRKHKFEKRRNYDAQKRTKDKDRDSKETGKRRDSSKDRDDPKFRERSRSHEDYKPNRRESSHYNESDKSEDKWFMRDRYRGYSDVDRERDRRFRDRSRSRDRDTHIDKKKLLEIARRNAIQMMKSGSLPAALTLGRQAQEKVLAAIRAGGKTIEELTDFCKTLSNKEELDELSSVSCDENDSDNDKGFHHPFQIKDRPTGIVMNIKNSTPLPIKTAQERSTELRMQFPVSSGTQHRKTESEWIPVSSKKIETQVNVPVPMPAPMLPVEEPVEDSLPELLPPNPQALPDLSDSAIDIGAIVSQRLTAMRKLQENPYDIEALNEMHKSQKEMQTWAESKQQPGQFTGSTGANILTQAELSSGYQAWAKKDQLQNAAPVCGGMGMHLLKKMGWNPGEGLGKEKTGTLEPLLLEVKLDKKGLLANEEHKKKQQKIIKSTVKTLEGKHPVSLLGEYTAKRKLGAPQYQICMESGPDHKKLFLFKVIVNGVEYKPDTASPNKKQAKADAAKLCLQQIGLLSLT